MCSYLRLISGSCQVLQAIGKSLILSDMCDRFFLKNYYVFTDLLIGHLERFAMLLVPILTVLLRVQGLSVSVKSMYSMPIQFNFHSA